MSLGNISAQIEHLKRNMTLASPDEVDQIMDEAQQLLNDCDCELEEVEGEIDYQDRKIGGLESELFDAQDRMRTLTLEKEEIDQWIDDLNGILQGDIEPYE